MLENKQIIVTGAAQGIGRSIAACCLREGARVVAVDIDHETLETFGRSNPEKIVTRVLDVSDRPSVEKLFDEFSSADGLVNNAGVYYGRHIFDYTDAALEHVWSVNLKAAFYCSRYYAKPVLDNGRSGVIVNLASLAGEEGSSDAVYGASKAALIGLTKSTAMNFAPAIRVNAVAPTVVETRMAARVPAWRMKLYREAELIKQPVRPEDVAETVVFLLSDRASHYTGAVLDINNGTYMR